MERTPANRSATSKFDGSPEQSTCGELAGPLMREARFRRTEKFDRYWEFTARLMVVGEIFFGLFYAVFLFSVVATFLQPKKEQTQSTVPPPTNPPSRLLGGNCMLDEDVIHGFFRYGCQYYVAGRYGVFAALIPVAANLQHHAIEMLLKGALSKTMTLAEMKNKLGHKLDKCWEAFKGMAGDASLRRFDQVIAELNKFEDIRYPDEILKSGASIMFDVTKAGVAMSSVSGVSQPQYRLCLEEIDELVGEIFKIASRNPDAYLKSMLREHALQYLNRDNAVFR